MEQEKINKVIEELSKLPDLPYKTRIDCAVYTPDEIRAVLSRL